MLNFTQYSLKMANQMHISFSLRSHKAVTCGQPKVIRDLDSICNDFGLKDQNDRKKIQDIWIVVKAAFQNNLKIFVICSISIFTNHILFALYNNPLRNQHGFCAVEIQLTTQKMDLNVTQK